MGGDWGAAGLCNAHWGRQRQGSRRRQRHPLGRLGTLDGLCASVEEFTGRACLNQSHPSSSVRHYSHHGQQHIRYLVCGIAHGTTSAFVLMMNHVSCLQRRCTLCIYPLDLQQCGTWKVPSARIDMGMQLLKDVYTTQNC